MKKYEFAQGFIDFLIACFISASLSSALLEGLRVPYNMVHILLIAFITCIMLGIVMKKAIIAIPLTGFIIFVIYIFSRTNGFIETISSFFQYQYKYFKYYVTEFEFMNATAWFWTIMITSVFYILIIKLRQFLLPAILGTLLLCILWALDHRNIVLYIWVFVSACIILWISSFEKSMAHKNPDLASGLWPVYVIPLSLLIIITSFLITPIDTETFGWSYLKDRFDRLELFHGGNSGSKLGFSDSTEAEHRLGGPIELDDNIVMEVKSKTPLYLRGTVLNYYTGTSWKNTLRKDQYIYGNAVNQWNYQWITAFNFYEFFWNDTGESKPWGWDVPADLKNKYKLFPYVRAVITHVDINSTTLFNAMQMQDINIDDNLHIYYNAAGETFIRNEQKDLSYTIEARIPTLSSEELQNYIKNNSPSVDWDDIPNVIVDGSGKGIRLVSQYDKNYIKRNYMNVPYNVPYRVSELAHSITDDLHSTFEKVLAIHDYLKDNFTYTLSPPHTPVNQDFVDYFLFDLKEGYCTYFATAMSVMLRTIGIPSRYIEGFAMPSQPNKDGIYEVKDLHAHAWVEVYFPYFGWMPFDPTPSGNIHSLGAYRDSEDQSTPEPSTAPTTPEPSAEPTENPTTTKPVNDKNKDDTDNNINAGSIHSLLTVFNIIAVAIALIIFIMVLLNKLYWLWVEKQSSDVKITLYYNKLLHLFMLLGYPLRRAETPYMYADRIDSSLKSKKGNMMDVSELYVQSQFGNYSLSDDDMLQVKTFYFHIRKSMPFFRIPERLKLFIRESFKYLQLKLKPVIKILKVNINISR